MSLNHVGGQNDGALISLQTPVTPIRGAADASMMAVNGGPKNITSTDLQPNKPASTSKEVGSSVALTAGIARTKT
jgi:hypothetical protein